MLLGLPAYAGLGVCWYAVVAFDGEARLCASGRSVSRCRVMLSALLIPSGGDEGAAWTYVGSPLRDRRALPVRSSASSGRRPGGRGPAAATPQVAET